jgi:hypothetical protein
MAKTTVVGVRLDPHTIEALATLAGEQGVSVAMMARILLVAALRSSLCDAATRRTETRLRA